MRTTSDQWIRYGKSMMLFSGIILILFPLYAKEDFIHAFMKFWVMAHGAACILLFFTTRSG